ncbi:MAG TPA: flagellar basal body rod protein FlgC [Candidatus Acidoferrales bacterium]|nr:flagellar basal body rod protein FlgC [Candidatus Acidoferrales bacterium]
MNLFGMMQLSGSALLAERERAELTASNLANAETTRTMLGGPYRRQNVVFASDHPLAPGFAVTLASFTDWHAEGVRVAAVVTDMSAPSRRFDPGHPDADASGYVSFPNINPVEESVNLMEAARSYQMNVSAIQAVKAMIQSAIGLAT